MGLENEFEAMKNFQECPLPNIAAIKQNNRRCVIVEDLVNKFFFGEVEYEGDKIFYHLNLPSGERKKLYYSNTKKVFSNGKY